MGGIGNCCCGTETCSELCPDYVIPVSYDAVLDGVPISGTITLAQDGTDPCLFAWADCYVLTATETNSWTVNDDIDPTAYDPCDAIGFDPNYHGPCPGCWNTTYTRRISAYLVDRKYKRWRQEIGTVSIQVYSVGGGMLRIALLWNFGIMYAVGMSERVTAVTWVVTINTGQPLIEGSGGVEQELILATCDWTMTTDTAVTFTEPDYPPSNCPESYLTYGSCVFSIVSTPPTPRTSLEMIESGTTTTLSCASALSETCLSSTIDHFKAVSRMYVQDCSAGSVAPGDTLCYVNPFDFDSFGEYAYYSDEFPCEDILAGPITLKRVPYTDLAATSTSTTVCGQTITKTRRAIPKDITITLS